MHHRRLAAVNATALSLAVVGNGLFQVYCRPVTWAAVVAGACFVAAIVYPMAWRRGRGLGARLAFVNGVGFGVFAYCVAFQGGWTLAAIPMTLLLGLGLLGLIMPVLALQLLWTHLLRAPTRAVRRGFSMGVAVCVIVLAVAVTRYRAAVAEVRSFAAGDGPPPTSVMAERILGTHFLYHTRISIYDGWRPPLHAPLLSAARWLSGGAEPLPISLTGRIALYREAFPDCPIRLDCACALDQSPSYHRAAPHGSDSDPHWWFW